MKLVMEILYHAVIPLTLALILCGCTLEDERDLCCPDPLTMHFVYRPLGVNTFHNNIHTLRHFLFDGEGTFITEIPQSSEIDRLGLNMNPGSYTMVTVGNMSGNTLHEYGEEKTISQFLLRHTAPAKRNLQAFDITDELFWGVKHFSIDSDSRGAEESLSRIGYATNVLVTEMSNIHCHLNVTVEWVGRPPYVGNYEMELSGIHTKYSLNPESATLTADGFSVPEGQDCSDYRLDVPLRQLGLRAEFVTLRYTDASIPTLRIKFDGKTVIPEIDLGKAFRAWGWHPSATHVQEYNILLRVINENHVDVVPMIEGSVADWVNGGSFG